MGIFNKKRVSIPELRDGEQKIFFLAGGEWSYLWTPPSFKVNEKAPVVIHHHGAGGFVRKRRADWIMTKSKASFLKAVMEGCHSAVAGSHACGDHWGNPRSVNANAALLRILDQCAGLDTERIGLMGGGMAGILVWNSVLGPFEGRVRLVAVLQAAVSLEAIVRDGRFKAVCLKAHGLSKDAPVDPAIERIRPFDPMHRMKTLQEGSNLPTTAIYHGAGDSSIPPETHAIPLGEALRRAGAQVDMNIFTGMKHDIYAMGGAMEDKLREFFSRL